MSVPGSASGFAAISKSIFLSKIFWTCVVGAIAQVLTACGVHVFDDPAVQAQAIGLVMAGMVVIFRVGTSQPVHVVAPETARRLAILIAPIGFALWLGACAAVTTIASLATSPIGMSFINAIFNTLVPGMNTAIANGAAAGKSDLDMVAYVMPWAKSSIDYFKPANQVAIDTLIDQVQVDLAKPQDIGTLMVEVQQAWTAVQSALAPAKAGAPQ